MLVKVASGVWGVSLCQADLESSTLLFSLLSKQNLPIEYSIHIWQVSLQLSCGETYVKYESD